VRSRSFVGGVFTSISALEVAIANRKENGKFPMTSLDSIGLKPYFLFGFLEEGNGEWGGGGRSGHGHEVGQMPQDPTQMPENLSVRFSLGGGKGGSILHGLRRHLFGLGCSPCLFLAVGKVHKTYEPPPPKFTTCTS
jgi:hypothetical protein